MCILNRYADLLKFFNRRLVLRIVFITSCCLLIMNQVHAQVHSVTAKDIPTTSKRPGITLSEKVSVVADQKIQKQWNIWLYDLSRWIQLCVGRKERKEAMFYGCRGRLWSIQGQWALLRVSHISHVLGMSNPKIDWKSWQNRQDLTELERIWRLAFVWEKLQVEGDLAGRTILTNEINAIYQEWKAKACIIGTACPIALYHLLKMTHSADAHLLKEVPWHELQLWAYQQSTQIIKPHSNATLEADHTRKSAESWWTQRALLAALILDQSQLQTWWQQEHQSSGFNLNTLTIPLEQRQLGIHFQRAWGLGVLAYLLNDQSLVQAMEAHLMVAQHIYRAYQRKYRSYTYRVPAWGVMVLSELLGLFQPWQQHFSPHQWKNRDAKLLTQLKSIPPQGIRKSGMFSEMIVRQHDSTRSLFFIRPNGSELLESQINFKYPDVLQVAYTKEMIGVYAFVPNMKDALLIGVGGGGMVHALQSYHPLLNLDAVEIDPVVVEFAKDYFGVKDKKADTTTGKTSVITQDGFDFLAQTQNRYDVIYMDAFLQPTEETDSTGSPLKLKTLAFLKGLHSKLTAHGAIVININEHAELNKDIQTVRAAFPYSMVWQVPNTGNWIAIGMLTDPRVMSLKDGNYNQHNKLLQTKYHTPFSFIPMMKRALDSLFIKEQ